MNKTLTKVALRYKALYIDINRKDIYMRSETSIPIMAFIAELKELGYCVSEELLHALNLVNDNALQEITDCINEVLQTDLNWAPFETTYFVYKAQASKLKELRLFTADDMQHLFNSLLTSATPLYRTQRDTLQQLLGIYPIPENIDVKMKETAIIVARTLVEQGKDEQKMCLRVACWLNAIPMNAADIAKEMNSKREMWVRMIRALRLGEYSRKKGMKHLAEILDRFYKHSYFT